jgi:hypothetical protein
MRRIIFPAAAGLALVVASGLAAAQDHRGREHERGPAAGGGRGPAAGGQREQAAPRGLQGGGRHGFNPERAERQVQESRPRVERRQVERARPQVDRGEQRRAATQERARAEQRRTEQRNLERRNTENARRQERERSAREGRRTGEQRRAAERPAIRPDQRAPDQQAADRNRQADARVSGRHEDLQRARLQLNADQRRRLHGAFDLSRARVSTVRFDHRVGHRIPRNIHLLAVPRDVIGFFPYYRDYSYFVVGDEICIVDPQTYVIVDVIDATYYRPGPRQEVAALSLSSAQMALVRESVPPNFPEANVRLRLALGAEIPPDVELYDFPVLVLDQAPVLKDYRFLVAADQIVVVDPANRSIALVIDRA